MPKTPAAIYAQKRRDNEIQAREALSALVPSKYLTGDLENGEFNMSTKVFLATERYLKDIQPDNHASKDNRNEAGNSAKQTQNHHRPPALEANANGDITSEAVQQLRQVATRLVQKVEEKLAAGGGLSKELERLVETLSDHMIDSIEIIAEAT